MKAKFYFLILMLICLEGFGQVTNYYLKGVDFYAKADYINAQKQFERALEQNFEAKYNIYTYLGLSKHSQAKYEAAYLDYQLAILELNKLGYTKMEDMPANIVQAYALTVYDRGLAQHYRGLFQDAINDFNYALMYKYSPGDCYYALANSYYNLADYSKAVDNFTIALGYKPNEFSIYYWRGSTYLGLEKWDDAIKDFDLYLSQNPKDPYAYHYRGYAKAMSGKTMDALQDTKMTIELKIKDLYLPYRNLGIIYTNLDDCKGAKESYEKALSYKSDDTYSKNNLELLKVKCNKSEVVSKPIFSQSLFNKPTAPDITWVYPKEESIETSEQTITVKACVNSSEKPIMSLFVEGVQIATRDFKMVSTKEPDCPYRFEKQINISPSTDITSLKFVAKNSGGTKESIRNIYKIKASNPVATEKRIALLIGNASYKIKPLKNTLNDVEDMAKKLEGLGFKVIKHTNLNSEQMSLAFIKFGKELSNYDVGMFFYAGHGLQNNNGSNYLVPVDAELIRTEQDFNKYCIEVDELFGQMRKASTKVNIIILDACRDNPLDSRSFTRGSGTRGLSAPSQNPQGSFIFYAASANQTALDGEGGRNGIFTGELLKYIDKPNMKLEDVVKETSKAVKQKTNDQQKPAWYSEFDGDFYFRH